MLTKSVWEEFLYSEYYENGKKVRTTSYGQIFICLFFSIPFIILDLALLPLELLALIIGKIIIER